METIEEKPNVKKNIKFMMNDLFDSNNDSSDDETESKDLDTSWILEHERLSTIKESYLRETMDSINCYFVYINRNQYIEKIITDKLPLLLSDDKTYSYLSKETLLQIIQSRKIKTPFSKYKLTDVVSYLVDLEPENIQSYSNSENEKNVKDVKDVKDLDNPFFNIRSFMDDIKFNNSIFIFHGINSIYFLFEEVELLNHRHTLKSILKTAESISDKSQTKKVRIQESGVDNNIKKDRRLISSRRLINSRCLINSRRGTRKIERPQSNMT